MVGTKITPALVQTNFIRTKGVNMMKMKVNINKKAVAKGIICAVGTGCVNYTLGYSAGTIARLAINMGQRKSAVIVLLTSMIVNEAVTPKVWDTCSNFADTILGIESKDDIDQDWLKHEIEEFEKRYEMENKSIEKEVV